MMKVDNDLARTKGVSIENAMNTLSTLVGSNYEISFIKYGQFILFRLHQNTVPRLRTFFKIVC
jgi:hypothetical protein